MANESNFTEKNKQKNPPPKPQTNHKCGCLKTRFFPYLSFHLSGLLSAGGDVGCFAVCMPFESPLLSYLLQLLGLEGVSRR